MASNQELPTIQYGYSSLRIFAMAGAGILMTLASASLAFQWLPTDGLGVAGVLKGATGVVAGYVGLVFFGVATAAAIWLLMRLPNGPVITISRDGLCDNRIAEEVIPWTLVVDVARPGDESVLLLRLSRAADLLVIHHRRRGRIHLGASAPNGLQILTMGLNATTGMILQTCRTYHAAARAS